MYTMHDNFFFGGINPFIPPWVRPDLNTGLLTGNVSGCYLCVDVVQMTGRWVLSATLSCSAVDGLTTAIQLLRCIDDMT